MPEEMFDKAIQWVEYVAYVWDGYDGSTSSYGLFSSLEDAHCYAAALIEDASIKYWDKPDAQAFHFSQALEIELDGLKGRDLTKEFLCELTGLDEIRLTTKIGNYLDKFSEYEEATFGMHVIIENRDGDNQLNISSQLGFSWNSGFYFTTWEC